MSVQLVRHICVLQERILFPPTTLQHLSDMGDILEAVATIVKPNNCHLGSLIAALDGRYGLTP